MRGLQSLSANLFNDSSVLGVDQRQSVELPALTEQSIEVGVAEHRVTLVRHVRMK